MQATYISVNQTGKQNHPQLLKNKKSPANVSMLINFTPKSLQRNCKPEVPRTKIVLGNPPRSYLIRIKAKKQTSQQNFLAWWLEAIRPILRAQVTVVESRPLIRPRVSSETQNEGMRHLWSRMRTRFNCPLAVMKLTALSLDPGSKITWMPGAWESLWGLPGRGDPCEVYLIEEVSAQTVPCELNEKSCVLTVLLP